MSLSPIEFVLYASNFEVSIDILLPWIFDLEFLTLMAKKC
jgi:hypothetical protein